MNSASHILTFITLWEWAGTTVLSASWSELDATTCLICVLNKEQDASKVSSTTSISTDSRCAMRGLMSSWPNRKGSFELIVWIGKWFVEVNGPIADLLNVNQLRPDQLCTGYSLPDNFGTVSTSGPTWVGTLQHPLVTSPRIMGREWGRVISNLCRDRCNKHKFHQEWEEDTGG